MPSTSKKQARLMAACAHGADYKSCPPKKVAKKFNKDDKGTGILKKEQHELTFKQFLLCESSMAMSYLQQTELYKSLSGRNQALARRAVMKGVESGEIESGMLSKESANRIQDMLADLQTEEGPMDWSDDRYTSRDTLTTN